MKGYVKVARLRDLRPGRGFLVTVEGTDVALFRAGDDIVALNNVCAHQHFSMLHDGKVDEDTVMCPMHGWVYELRTGRSLSGQGKVACYPVKIAGEDIMIEIPEVA
jgi:nitrite reductase/ring-hydroxylating ferredoxin subunit